MSVVRLFETEDALRAVYDEFTEDNDPYKEHEFGKCTVEGTDIFWKIDYYDTSMQMELLCFSLLFILTFAEVYITVLTWSQESGYGYLVLFFFF